MLLKAFQRLGYFPKLSEVAITIVSHIRSCLDVEQAVERRDEATDPLSSSSGHPHVSARDDMASRETTDHQAVAGVAETMDTLPTSSTWRWKHSSKSGMNYQLSVPWTGWSTRAHRCQSTVLSHHPHPPQPEDATRLDGLLNTEGHGSEARIQRLKQLPKRPSLQHLQDWITQLEWLLSLGDITSPWWTSRRSR